MKKWKKWGPALTAAAVCAVWLAAGVLPQLTVRRQPLADFAVADTPTHAVAEVAERGYLYCHVAAYSVPLGEPTAYFDYIQADAAQSMAQRQQLALVRDGTVWRLPTVATLRADLWERLNLPQYADSEKDNFYVGLESRAPAFLLPRGTYQLAVLQQSADGVWRLLPIAEVTL